MTGNTAIDVATGWAFLAGLAIAWWFGVVRANAHDDESRAMNVPEETSPAGVGSFTGDTCGGAANPPGCTPAPTSTK